MGLRDRIRGFGAQAGSQAAGLLKTAAGIMENISRDSRGGPSVGPAGAPPPGTGGPSAKPSPNPTENFNSGQIRQDAEAMSRAMREAWFPSPAGIPAGNIGERYYGDFDAAEFAKARGPAGGIGAASADSRAARPGQSAGNLIGGGLDSDGLVPTQGAVDDPKALYWDPFALVQQLGFRERPSAITYATLASMVWRVPIVQAILQTRINQVSSFATAQHYKFETGFRIKMRDPEAKPSPADKKFIREMQRMILACGVESPNHVGRDSFETFLRKIVRDSLTYDQACWEIVPGKDGRPAEWYAVDAATIRLADTARLYPDDDPDRVRTVQIYDNVIIGEFTGREMAFMVRNPRTDIRSYGYGTSELEMVVSTITAILWAWHYNQNFFSQGSVAKGLLNLVGAIPEKHLRAFRRQWYQMVSGVENAWRTPITNAEKVEWIDMHTSNRDMEFSAWMDFLIKVVCSVYVMDPIEINFKYGTQAQRSMFEGAQRAKSQESRERGLKPLLRAIGREIDRTIIWPINPEFTMEFVGLESQTPKELADLMTQRVRTTYTIDEIRAESDQAPLKDGLGDIILDANWINARNQVLQQKQAEAQQQQQMQAQAQASAGGGVNELEGMLAQLEGKPPKMGGPASGGLVGGKPGGGPGGPAGMPGAGAGPGGASKKPPPGIAGKSLAGQPHSTPAQTDREIRNELQGVGTAAPMELSRRTRGDLSKGSDVIEIEV